MPILSKELRAVFIPHEKVVLDSRMQKVELSVTVAFEASVFGSFSQRLLFNFGQQTFLKKDFNIDIGSKETLEKLADTRKTVILNALPWDDGNVTIKKSLPDPEKEKLMSTYNLPKDAERIVSAQLVEGEIRKDTYKQTMHQLLFAEEVHMRKLLLRYQLTICRSFNLVLVFAFLVAVFFFSFRHLSPRVNVMQVLRHLEKYACLCIKHGARRIIAIIEARHRSREGTATFQDGAGNYKKTIVFIYERIHGDKTRNFFRFQQSCNAIKLYLLFQAVAAPLSLY